MIREMTTELRIPLRGPKGEPVDLMRIFMSHGVADLRPGQVDEEERAYTTTLALAHALPRTIRISAGRPGFVRVEVEGRKLGQQAARELSSRRRCVKSSTWTKTSPSSMRSLLTIPPSRGPLRERAGCFERRQFLRPLSKR